MDGNRIEFIGIRRVMAETGFAVSRIQRLALDGRIETFIPPGGSRLYRLADAMRLAEEARAGNRKGE